MHNEDSKSCPYCKGKLFIRNGYKEKIVNGHRSMYPYTHPCYCELNRIIGKRFGILYPLPDASPEDSDDINAKYIKNSHSIIFYGDESAFLYTVKCALLKLFTHKDCMLLEGVNLVDKYNVVQKDGERPTINALDQYDLLALLFTSRSEPPTLKACIADTLKNRARLGKATWVYAADKESLTSSKEYSKDLASYLETYSVVEIGAATGYVGFSKSMSERTIIRSARNIQDELGKS